MRSLDIAGTGMQAQQTNVEVISNNMANMTTTGFKRRRTEFQDLIPSARISDTSAPTVPPVMANVGRSRQTMKGPCQRVKTYAAWYYLPEPPPRWLRQLG
jgi:flagellar basal-body rod protein FlgG